MTRVAGTMAIALLLGACASSGTTTAQGTTAATRPENEGGHHHGEHGGEHHHHEMPAPMTAFHEVLRPLWHSDAGAARDARTCEQAATLRARATPVAEMPVPESAREREQGWRTATAQLVATSDALVAACGATPRGNVAGALEAVHTAFHGVMDQLGHRHGP